MHGFEPVDTADENAQEVGDSDIREISAILVHGLADAARQIEEETGWQVTAMGELHASAYCLFRALLDILPVLEGKDAQRPRVESLLDEAAREACGDHFRALHRAGAFPAPDLKRTLADVFRGAVAGLVDNAVLMHHQEAPGAFRSSQAPITLAGQSPGVGAPAKPGAGDFETD